MILDNHYNICISHFPLVAIKTTGLREYLQKRTQVFSLLGFKQRSEGRHKVGLLNFQLLNQLRHITTWQQQFHMY